MCAATLVACGGSTDQATRNRNANIAANTNRNQGASQSPRFFARELDPYSGVMKVTDATGSSADLEIARMRGDRRYSAQLPGIGGAVYLEKAGINYFILPSRNQYTELPSDALGFVSAQILNPVALVEKLIAGTQHEKLGKELIDNRMTNKFRLVPATGSSSNKPQTEITVYVDEGNGLPIRIEKKAAGDVGPVFIDTHIVELNPDSSLFEVPPGTRKVAADQLRSQSQSLIDFLQKFAQLMGYQTAPSQTPASATQNRNSSSATANGNSRQSR
jgi:hypothetical protein